MARCRYASWRPVSVNFNYGGCKPRLVVVHIMQGTLAGSDNWFRNPAAEASAHFGTGKGGSLYQWVDTGDTAWHCAGGNSVAIGIENEGYAGERLSAVQVERNAQVLAWAHTAHSVPLRLAQGTSDAGLGWHGMGGDAWGGHDGCPGAAIVGQLAAIVARAKVLASPPKPPTAHKDDEPMPMLQEGYDRDTVEVFHPGNFKSVMLGCDNSQHGLPRPKLRIAERGGNGSWHISHVELPASDALQVVFTRSDVSLLIITRESNGAGDSVAVGYRIYP